MADLKKSELITRPLGLQLSLSICISEYIQDFKVRVSVGALMT